LIGLKLNVIDCWQLEREVEITTSVSPKTRLVMGGACNLPVSPSLAMEKLKMSHSASLLLVIFGIVANVR
jgi:hypothetical protein